MNADEIAKGLSPFQPEKLQIESGRIMLSCINELLDTDENFAFETTLASKSYRTKIQKAQQEGFNVILLFFWLQNVDLAIERVRTRVLEGGHNVESHVIKRRYKNGIKNLFNIYIPIVGEVMIFDNSEGKYELLAEKTKETQIDVLNKIKFNQIKQSLDETI